MGPAVALGLPETGARIIHVDTGPAERHARPGPRFLRGAVLFRGCWEHGGGLRQARGRGQGSRDVSRGLGPFI